MKHPPPRPFFDVSYVVTSTANTGIHRVVRHLLREMIDRPEWRVIPFCAADGGTRVVSRREVIDKMFAPFDLLRGDEKVSDRPSRMQNRWTHVSGDKLFNTLIPRARRLVASLLPVKAWQHFILGSNEQPGSLARCVLLLYWRSVGARKGFPVLWLKNADDVVLEAAYAHASCVIQASLCEGFGLPVIESMLRNKPLVCSDIPVFREVAGAYHCAYFRTDHSAALTSIMHRIARNPTAIPSSASLLRNSAGNDWATVAQTLLAILNTQ